MIYIQVDEKGSITTTHFAPFDPDYGMGKTEAELLKTGYLVDSIPEFESKDGYIAETRYNVSTKEFYCEYVKRPAPAPTEAERLRADIDYLAVMANITLYAEETESIEKMASRYYPVLWSIERIKALVENEKLTKEQYKKITGEDYV